MSIEIKLTDYSGRELTSFVNINDDEYSIFIEEDGNTMTTKDDIFFENLENLVNTFGTIILKEQSGSHDVKRK